MSPVVNLIEYLKEFDGPRVIGWCDYVLINTPVITLRTIMVGAKDGDNIEGCAVLTSSVASASETAQRSRMQALPFATETQ